MVTENVPSWIARHPARFTLACMTVVGVLAMGFAQYKYTQSLNAVCEGNAETRQVLVDVAAALSRDTPIPAGTDPATVERIERSNASKAAVRGVVTALSAPEPCDDGQTPPSRVGDYGIDPLGVDAGTTTTTGG